MDRQTDFKREAQNKKNCSRCGKSCNGCLETTNEISHKNTAPRITKNGAKLTKQYFKRGGYRSAKKDFLRFKPTHVQSLGKVRVHVIPNERDIP